MLKIILSTCIAILVVLCVVYQQWQTALFAPLNVDKATQFEVKKGIGFNQLCMQWQKNGWLEHCLPYQLMAKLNPRLTDLKAGLYELTNESIIQNIKKINQGQQISFSFTIIEGQTLNEVIANITKHDKLTDDLDRNNLSTQIANNEENLEGWLFPETYHYHKGDTASSVLKRARSKMDNVLSQAWQQRQSDLPLNNAYEALILASIIEKETGVASERSTIASVFINRLNKNMRLQTDPTVIYGLGERYDGDIKRKDLREYTPYNTYRINGLPPTPIAMPSEAAIFAAVNPTTSSFYYFVAKGNGDGSHQFSVSLEQHNAAVRNYLLNNKN
ncbi:endolytic transglycosylase MltG [Pseudoalteromonas sp. MMG010]|uniref:endolytic transglycosylase MltG n=1 Tax=Pseudoalteromonas sp. MMG010 TaxID=2822685 RepID=UPI001B39E02D|nr:endolytic transglycosylase MltG [Pseudoalteromonas sp. MMG010]